MASYFSVSLKQFVSPLYLLQLFIEVNLNLIAEVIGCELVLSLEKWVLFQQRFLINTASLWGSISGSG